LISITEYGEIVTGSTLDEWGRHWLSNIVEDGTRVIVTAYTVTVVTKAVSLKGEKGALLLKGAKSVGVVLKGNKGDVKID
jgi:hypothetical protein